MRLRETGGAGKGTVARSTSDKELADVSRELRRVTAGRSALDHHAVLVGDEEHGIALTRSARNLLSRHAVHERAFNRMTTNSSKLLYQRSGTAKSLAGRSGEQHTTIGGKHAKKFGRHPLSLIHI